MKKRLLFHIPDKPRKELYVDEVCASEVKRYVDALITAMKTGVQNLDAENWISRLPEQGIRTRLQKWGLLHTDQIASPKTLQQLKVHVLSKIHVPNTKRNYNNYFNNLIEYMGLAKKLNTVTVDDAEKILDWLINEKQYKPTNISRIIRGFKGFFEEAWRMRWCEENPFRFLKYNVTTNIDRWLYIPADVIAAMIDNVKNPETRLLIALARFAGIRGGSEAYSLTWDKGCITWPNNGNTGSIVITTEKTKKFSNRVHRTIPLMEPLIHCLVAMKQDKGKIFPNRQKEWRIDQVIARQLNAADIEFKVVYNLRRSFCSDIMECIGGTDPKAYEMICGHNFGTGMLHYQIMHKDRTDKAFNAVIQGLSKKLE